MRIVLRLFLALTIIALSAVIGAFAGVAAAFFGVLLGAVAIGVSEAVDRLGKILTELRWHSQMLEDQRTNLRRLADTQAKAWERRNVA